MRLLFLERDIDMALRRMALEEEKNLTETVNDILWKGLRRLTRAHTVLPGGNALILRQSP